MDSGIPAGTFSAEFSSESERKAVVIRLIREIGEKIAQDHADEIKRLYENVIVYYRNADIARIVVPDEFEKNEGVAEKAIGYAIMKIYSNRDDTRKTIERWRKAKSLEERSGSPDSEEFRDFCRRASARRHEIHGVNHQAMTRGRGFIPWGLNEKAYVLMLKEKGYGNGEIAVAVNRDFHEGKGVRGTKGVYDMIRYEQRKISE